MSTLRSTLTVASLAAAVVGLSACGSSSTPPAAAPAASASTSSSPSKSSSPSTSSSTSATPSTSAPAAASGSLDAANQSSDGKSVVVDSVKIDAAGKGGWIALHTDVGGKPGPVKYFVAVPSGASTKVVVPTAEGIPSGD